MHNINVTIILLRYSRYSRYYRVKFRETNLNERLIFLQQTVTDDHISFIIYFIVYFDSNFTADSSVGNTILR